MRLAPIVLVPLLAAGSLASQSPPPRASIEWPVGKRAAVSLSFDDGRSSQMDAGLPVLDALGLKVTFYVVPERIRARQTAWRAAARGGHEIGNHSLHHPCTGNFGWSRGTALEDYSLPQMDQELEQANAQIAELTGVRPKTFAYPCGQTFVGRGATTSSYVPLVSRRFAAGRLWLGETANDPAFVDLSQVHGVSMDDRDLAALRAMLDQTVNEGRWLVLAGHDIGEQPGPMTTRVGLLRELAGYLTIPERGIWVAPVGTVADWIVDQRENTKGRPD